MSREGEKKLYWKLPNDGRNRERILNLMADFTFETAVKTLLIFESVNSITMVHD